jgi:hypothetical protein
MSRLLLVARGTEKLKWGNVPLESELQGQRNVILEWAGRSSDRSEGVRTSTTAGASISAVDQAGRLSFVTAFPATCRKTRQLFSKLSTHSDWTPIQIEFE